MIDMIYLRLRACVSLSRFRDQEHLFLACNGVLEPDFGAAFHILNAALTGALPLAAWSNTFRASNCKPIFLLWIILLSVGHVFHNITYTDVNHHFQICPRFHVESLPQSNYQSVPLNPTWKTSLHALVSGQRPQSSIGNVNETLDSSCLYSCFASRAYIGRTPSEIDVYQTITPNYGDSRWGSITTWWAYLALGLLTFFTFEKPKLLPQVVRRPFFTLRPWPLVRTWLNRCFGSSEDYVLQQEVLQINAIKLVEFLTQLLSLTAFVGNIIYTEASKDQLQPARLQAESFSAVGQWGGVAVVVQVLIAVIFSYLWRIMKGRREKDLEVSTHCTTSLTSGSSRNFHKDEEVGDEEWDLQDRLCFVNRKNNSRGRYLEQRGLIQQKVNVCDDFGIFTPLVITITQSLTTLPLPPSEKHLKWQSL